MTLLDTIVTEIEQIIGQKPFVAVSALISLGLFGSYGAVQAGIREGRIPAIKISRYRHVVPKSFIISLIKEKFTNGGA